MKKRFLFVIIFYTAAIISLLLITKLLMFINFKCMLKEVFNIYCPGCGTTRMINSLMNFKIIEAFSYNPLMFILGVITAIYIVYASIIYIKTGIVKIPKTKTFMIIAIILVIYMILRNIPLFSFLAP